MDYIYHLNRHWHAIREHGIWFDEESKINTFRSSLNERYYLTVSDDNYKKITLNAFNDTVGVFDHKLMEWYI
mgnify:CR=1 FL=1